MIIPTIHMTNAEQIVFRDVRNANSNTRRCPVKIILNNDLKNFFFGQVWLQDEWKNPLIFPLDDVSRSCKYYTHIKYLQYIDQSLK